MFAIDPCVPDESAVAAALAATPALANPPLSSAQDIQVRALYAAALDLYAIGETASADDAICDIMSLLGLRG